MLFFDVGLRYYTFNIVNYLLLNFRRWSKGNSKTFPHINLQAVYNQLL